MLDSLITSKTRVKLLLKFFLNPDTRAYLRELAAEFGESSNAIRVELNRLTKAKLLVSQNNGRTVEYSANTAHTLFPDIKNVVHKYIGIDQLVEQLISELGQVDVVYITGDYAQGKDSGLIDLVLVGDLDRQNLRKIVTKTEELIQRKIRTLVVAGNELASLRKNLDIDHALLIWGVEPDSVKN